MPVVTGRIRVDDSSIIPLPASDQIYDHQVLDKKDIYKELRLRGYNYK